ELKAIPNWCVWKFEPQEDGSFAKVPHLVNGFGHAKCNDPKTWTTFDAALSLYQEPRYGYGGLSFAAEGLTGLGFNDTDDCIVDGDLTETGRAVLAGFSNTYIELSPSGHGLRIIARGVLPKNRHEGNFEIYSHSKFLTITGQQISESNKIADCTAAIDHY